MSLILTAALNYLRKEGVEVDEVLSLEQRMIEGGYCPTCAYHDIIVVFTYKNAGEEEEWWYDGSMAELVKELEKAA